MKNLISKYFTNKSGSYTRESNSFPWNLVRSVELKYFNLLLSKKKFKRGLDLGCGTGFYTKIIKKTSKEVYAVDLSRGMLNNIKDNKIKKILGDAYKLNLKKKFDLIICLGIFEFNKSYEKIFKTILLHSNTKTEIILMLPYRNLLSYLYYFFHLSHKINLNIMSKSKINLLIKNNFVILNKAYLFPFSAIFKCKKK